MITKLNEDPTISVVICTLNEEENLPNILTKIPDLVDEILLIDGHSTDATIEVATKLCPKIRIIYQTGKGKGNALRCGFEQAQGQIIITLDADNATDPKEIPRFIQPLLDGFDFVKGSRFKDQFPVNKPWYRILGNSIIVLTFDLLFFKNYSDLCSGYNAFWKSAIKQIVWPKDGFENEPFLNCQVAKQKLKVIEIGHLDKGRLKGEVKELSWRQGVKAIKSIIKVRFNLKYL